MDIKKILENAEITATRRKRYIAIDCAIDVADITIKHKGEVILEKEVRLTKRYQSIGPM